MAVRFEELRPRKLGVIVLPALLATLSACANSTATFNGLNARFVSIPPARAAAPEFVESPSTKPTTPDYWEAVADLDIDASRAAAANEQETRFASALALLVSGEHERAERAFSALIGESTDLNIVEASETLFATTLMYEHKWSALRDLSTRSATGAGQPTRSPMERWGAAFAGMDPQQVSFPADAVMLPLRVTSIGTPTILARINGKEYRFWIDTGSSLSVVSSDVAKEVGIPILSEDTLSVRTFAGTAPARPALISKLEIGGVVVSNSPAIVIDARLMRIHATGDGVPASGLPVDGIIGWDVIRLLDITLDYERGTATVQRPAALGTKGTGVQNLLWVGKPFVEVRTKSGQTFHFTLDTGAQSSFLYSGVIEKARVVTRSFNARAFGLANTAGRSFQAVPSLALDLGGRLLELRDLIVYDTNPSSLINCDGILGSNVAQYGAIRIDATNGLFSVGA
jgi:clan AA aspartic protease (TIGR02281 family)